MRNDTSRKRLLDLDSYNADCCQCLGNCGVDEMTVIEKDVVYAFTDEYPSMEHAIYEFARFGRQWVSTSIQGGRERLKFAVLGYTDSIGAKYVNGRCVSRKRKKASD